MNVFLIDSEDEVQVPDTDRSVSSGVSFSLQGLP